MLFGAKRALDEDQQEEGDANKKRNCIDKGHGALAWAPALAPLVNQEGLVQASETSQHCQRAESGAGETGLPIVHRVALLGDEGCGRETLLRKNRCHYFAYHEDDRTADTCAGVVCRHCRKRRFFKRYCKHQSQWWNTGFAPQDNQEGVLLQAIHFQMVK